MLQLLGAQRRMACGMHVHVTALLKGFKAQDLERKTTELLHPVQPLLSWEIPADCSLLRQKDGPRNEGLGGCGAHSIAKRAAEELENPFPGNVGGQVQPRQ